MANNAQPTNPLDHQEPDLDAEEQPADITNDGRLTQAQIDEMVDRAFREVCPECPTDGSAGTVPLTPEQETIIQESAAQLQRYANWLTDPSMVTLQPGDASLFADYNRNLQELQMPIDLRPPDDIPDWALSPSSLEARYDPRFNAPDYVPLGERGYMQPFMRATTFAPDFLQGGSNPFVADTQNLIQRGADAGRAAYDAAIRQAQQAWAATQRALGIRPPEPIPTDTTVADQVELEELLARQALETLPPTSLVTDGSAFVDSAGDPAADLEAIARQPFESVPDGIIVGSRDDILFPGLGGDDSDIASTQRYLDMFRENPSLGYLVSGDLLSGEPNTLSLEGYSGGVLAISNVQCPECLVPAASAENGYGAFDMSPHYNTSDIVARMEPDFGADNFGTLADIDYEGDADYWLNNPGDATRASLGMGEDIAPQTFSDSLGGPTGGVTYTGDDGVLRYTASGEPVPLGNTEELAGINSPIVTPEVEAWQRFQAADTAVGRAQAALEAANQDNTFWNRRMSDIGLGSDVQAAADEAQRAYNRALDEYGTAYRDWRSESGMTLAERLSMESAPLIAESQRLIESDAALASEMAAAQADLSQRQAQLNELYREVGQRMQDAGYGSEFTDWEAPESERPMVVTPSDDDIIRGDEIHPDSERGRFLACGERECGYWDSLDDGRWASLYADSARPLLDATVDNRLPGIDAPLDLPGQPDTNVTASADERGFWGRTWDSVSGGVADAWNWAWGTNEAPVDTGGVTEIAKTPATPDFGDYSGRSATVAQENMALCGSEVCPTAVRTIPVTGTPFDYPDMNYVAQPGGGETSEYDRMQNDDSARPPTPPVNCTPGTPGCSDVPAPRAPVVREDASRWRNIFSGNNGLGSNNFMGGNNMGLMQALMQLAGLGSGAGTGQQQPQPRPPIVVAPPPPPTPGTTTPPVLRPSVAVVASPNSIPVNGTSKLTWTALRANECEIRNQANGNILIRGGTQGTTTTLALERTTIFMLTCGGDNGTRSATATVYVGEPAPSTAPTQTTQPAPTITAGTSGATSGTGGTTSSGGSQTNTQFCDPSLDTDAFIRCLEQQPGGVNYVN